MKVVLNIGNAVIDTEFVKFLRGTGPHLMPRRSVRGGTRASIYNAIPLPRFEVVPTAMREFETMSS